MNYRSLLLAACAGLTLVSCVKDVESPEVSEIRDAKLEQIQSVTDLNKAQAAAVAKLADAEAALMAAQAEAEQAQAAYLKAQADLLKAQTEGQNIANQKALAELEAALIKAQYEKEKAQAQLERLALETELALINAQQQLLNAKKNYDSSKNSYLTSLANAYSSAASSLLNAQSTLISLKSQLVSAEESLVSLNEQKEQQIINNNRMIARYEAYLAFLKENVEMTDEQREAKIAELVAEAEKLYVEVQKAGEAYDNVELQNSRQEIISNSANNITNAAVQAFENYYNFYSYVASKTNVEGETVYSYEYWDNEENEYKTVDFAKRKLNSLNSQNTNYDEKVLKSEDGKYSITYREYSAAVVTAPEAAKTIAEIAKKQIAEQHEDAVEYYESWIAVDKKNIENINAEIAKYDEKTAPLKAKLEELEKAQETAFDEYLAAYHAYYSYYNEKYSEEAHTAAAYNDAINKRVNIENRIPVVESDIVIYKNNVKSNEESIVRYTKDLEDAQPDLKAAQEAVAEAQEAVAEKEAEIAPLKEAWEKAENAWWQKHLEELAGKVEDPSEVAELETAKNEAKAEYDAAVAELYPLEAALSQAESDLANVEANIKNLTDWIKNLERNLNNAKESLAKSEDELKTLKAELEKAVASEAEAKATADKAAENYYNDPKFVELQKANNEAATKYNSIFDEYKQVNNDINNIESVEYIFRELRINDDASSYLVNYYSLKSLLERNENYMEGYEQEIAAREVDLDKFNKAIDERVAEIEEMVAKADEYAALVAKHNELEVKTAEANIALIIARVAYNEVIAEISALEDPTKIEQVEGWIKNFKEANEDVLAITNQEQMIANIKEQIATQEKLVEAYTIAANEAKAALDAALAEFAEDVE